MIQSESIEKIMDSQILIRINNFIKNRLVEFSGVLLIIIGVFLLIAIISYSPADPNFIYTPEEIEIKNIGGFYGSVISDFLLQSIGLISFLIVLNLLNWGLTLTMKKEIGNFISKIFFTVSYIIFGSTFINIFYNDSFWLIDNGNSGFVGRLVKETLYSFINLIENQYTFFTLILLTIIFFVSSLSIDIKGIAKILLLPYLIIKKIINFSKKNKENDTKIDNTNFNINTKASSDNILRETQPILPFAIKI